jgi:transcriptional pleiotropic repressor
VASIWSKKARISYVPILHADIERSGGRMTMSVELLDKTRKIGNLLHNNNNTIVIFNDFCRVLTEILSSSVVVLSRKGKVLGVGKGPGVGMFVDKFADDVGGFVDPLFNERLLAILSTKENCNLQTLGFSEEQDDVSAVVTPVYICGERLGTIFFCRKDRDYDIDDIILCEYATTVVGLEMMRAVHEENTDEERRKQDVKSAISTLSYSEQEAAVHIFEELSGNDGILVASRIADRAGITRSVIVNALRKFESAGVIETRSAGMKGTSIKVKNDLVFSELKKLKSN